MILWDSVEGMNQKCQSGVIHVRPLFYRLSLSNAGQDLEDGLSLTAMHGRWRQGPITWKIIGTKTKSAFPGTMCAFYSSTEGTGEATLWICHEKSLSPGSELLKTPTISSFSSIGRST